MEEMDQKKTTEQDNISDGREQPIKLNKEEMARRKETGYTEEEAKTAPGAKSGQGNRSKGDDTNSES